MVRNVHLYILFPASGCHSYDLSDVLTHYSRKYPKHLMLFFMYTTVYVIPHSKCYFYPFHILHNLHFLHFLLLINIKWMNKQISLSLSIYIYICIDLNTSGVRTLVGPVEDRYVAVTARIELWVPHVRTPGKCSNARTMFFGAHAQSMFIGSALISCDVSTRAGCPKINSIKIIIT